MGGCKRQVSVEYGWWMIGACLVGFYAWAIHTSPEHSWNVFLFTCTCICPFFFPMHFFHAREVAKCGCT